MQEGIRWGYMELMAALPSDIMPGSIKNIMTSSLGGIKTNSKAKVLFVQSEVL